jgi:hypothetical protein
MNRIESLTKALIEDVTQGNRTVKQLKTKLKDGLAFVQERGAHNIQLGLLITLKALDNAITQIELNRAKANRRRDN